MALRYFLLGTQYRSPVNYSLRQLDSASDRLFYLYQACHLLINCLFVPVFQLREFSFHLWQTLEDCRVVLESSHGSELSIPPEVKSMSESLLTSFHSSMRDDLHTGLALSSFTEALKAINDFLHTKKVTTSPRMMNDCISATRDKTGRCK